MLLEIALARAETLREWASDIEKEALAGAEGYGEIVMLVRRAAIRLERAVGIKPQAVGEVDHTPARESAELREG